MAEPVTIYGSLVELPEARYTNDGDLVVNFRMVQDDRYNANRTGGPPDFQDRKPSLYFDVAAWRQEWLAEAALAPGDRVVVRGAIRQEKDYPHPKIDEIKRRIAATGANPDEMLAGLDLIQKGGVRVEAKEVLVSTAQRILTTRNPHKDGTAAARKQQSQGGGQQQPDQGGDQWGGQQRPPQAQPPQQPQQAPPQGQQGDPWAQHAQQQSQPPQQPQHAPPQGPPQGQQGDPWAQQPQQDPWAKQQG